MSWHQGFALAQNVLTCAYIHDLDGLFSANTAFAKSAASRDTPNYPTELMSKVLRAYLRGALKTCDIVMEELLKGHVYDVGSSCFTRKDANR